VLQDDHAKQLTREALGETKNELCGVRSRAAGIFASVFDALAPTPAVAACAREGPSVFAPGPKIARIPSGRTGISDARHWINRYSPEAEASHRPIAHWCLFLSPAQSMVPNAVGKTMMTTRAASAGVDLD